MDADDASAIGARARKIRSRRGLSLDVTAGLAGISKPYLSMLERGQRGFNRRGLIEDLADALGCSVVDLTGQPFAPPDRGTADALATIPGISLAINDCTLDDVPDLPARPVEQLVTAAAAANAHLDAAQFSLAGRELGAVLAELHVAAVTGDTDTRRAPLAALAEACLVGASIARHLGHADLAVQTARRSYDAAQRLGDSTRAGLLTMHRALHHRGALGDCARRRIRGAIEPAARHWPVRVERVEPVGAGQQAEMVADGERGDDGGLLGVPHQLLARSHRWVLRRARVDQRGPRCVLPAAFVEERRLPPILQGPVGAHEEGEQFAPGLRVVLPFCVHGGGGY